MIRGDVIVRVNREIPRKLTQAQEKAADQLGVEIEREIKRQVNRDYPPASRPGNYPHKRSGAFRANIVVRTTRRALTILSGAPWGKWLEGGTRRMRRRPWAARQFEGSKGKRLAKRYAELVQKFMRGGATKLTDVYRGRGV